MELIEHISNILEKKVTYIYYLVIMIFILFLSNHILNNYLLHLNTQKHKKEHFNNQPRKNIYDYKTCRIDLDKNSNNKVEIKEELNSILKFNKNIKDDYSCLTNNKDLKKSGCIQTNDNSESLVINKIDSKKKYKHAYKSDDQIEYYYKNENIKQDDYLQYYSKKFQEYKKKPKNKSNYEFLEKNNYEMFYKNILNEKISGDFEKDNLENVKEINFIDKDKIIEEFKELPIRFKRSSCFKCQRPYLICNESHLPKDTTNKISFKLKAQDKINKTLLEEKNEQIKTRTSSLTKETLDKENKIINENKKKIKNKMKSIQKNVKNICCNDEKNNYLKFKRRYKQDFKKNRKMNSSELENIIELNNN